jgi:phage terminase Nu1 subunit (DNA packaging protein)
MLHRVDRLDRECRRRFTTLATEHVDTMVANVFRGARRTKDDDRRKPILPSAWGGQAKKAAGADQIFALCGVRICAFSDASLR